jgi:hypothetical protein
MSPDVTQALNILLPADFSHRISVLDGCDKSSLPDWAASLVWLGAWCRSNRLASKRLIVFAVLPTRELAAAFTGLGCLIAGASNFEDALSWPMFKKLPSGRGVFWRSRSGTKHYCGNIVGFKEYDGSEFIVVDVTKASKKAEVGTRCEISRNYFDDYQFTEEKPPTAPRSAALDVAARSLRYLVDNLNPKWIWADGAEGLIVTNVATFQSSLDGLFLSIEGQDPVAMSDLLCLERNKIQSHAKLRIDHPKGVLSGNFPIVILDGLQAFVVHEHLADVSNMLVILDRSEYQEGIHDAVLVLRSISSDVQNTDFMNFMPGKFTPGIELAAYWIDEQ